MFLRIAITSNDEDSHQRQGIFVASHGLLDSGDLTGAEAASRRALFWFRPGAREFLPKAWELAQLAGRRRTVQRPIKGAQKGHGRALGRRG